MIFEPAGGGRGREADREDFQLRGPHFQYHVTGRLAIRMDDGNEFIAGLAT